MEKRKKKITSLFDSQAILFNFFLIYYFFYNSLHTQNPFDPTPQQIN